MVLFYGIGRTFLPSPEAHRYQPISTGAKIYHRDISFHITIVIRFMSTWRASIDGWLIWYGFYRWIVIDKWYKVRYQSIKLLS